MSSNQTPTGKLAIFPLDTIQQVLAIISTMKPEGIEESRKQIMAFDTLNKGVIQIVDAPTQEELNQVANTEAPVEDVVTPVEEAVNTSAE